MSQRSKRFGSNSTALAPGALCLLAALACNPQTPSADTDTGDGDASTDTDASTSVEGDGDGDGTDTGTETGTSDECAEGEILTAWGECLPWAHRYEPELQQDADNVIYYAGTELTELTDLNPPPRSGFRLISDPYVLGPFEQAFFCQSWQLPELDNRYIYTAELRVSQGLHHANMFAIPPQEGYDEPQPSPGCHPGAAGHIGTGISNVLQGELLDPADFPEVLFANSTQIAGGESLEFPDGVAFHISNNEVVLDTHYYNTSDQPITIELVYDFYTMPEELVTHPVVPNVYLFLDFLIDANVQHDLVADCPWYGGEVSAIMPHMHEWGVGYDVKFKDDQDNVVSNPYSLAGFNLPESDIQIYEDLISETAGASKVQFTCTINNTNDHPMCMGTGENEMCFLFAYTYPPQSQAFGIIPTDGADCVAFNTGRPETIEPFDVIQYLGQQDPAVQQRLIEFFQTGFAGDGTGNFSTCPDLSPAY